MLGVLLKILGALGWILLGGILVLFVVLLLVLFYPVTYVAWAKRDEERTEAWIRFHWLFGLIRAEYVYPLPGAIHVKIFGWKVFDSSLTQTEKGKNIKPEKPVDPDSGTGEESGFDERPDPAAKTENDSGSEAERSADPGSCRQDVFGSLQEKLDGFADKINRILSNLQYYLEILREEDTVQLLSHGFFRTGRIFRSLRPRKIRGSLYFGTGSPDTTGYCMALYGMLFPTLGNHLEVTPDFERENAVLTGELYMKGYMRASVFLYHIVRVLLDRRLHSRIKKIKKGGQGNGG